jgi:hypothetical protein
MHRRYHRTRHRPPPDTDSDPLEQRVGVWSVFVSDPEVICATPADRERVVETVVAAFEADPAFRFFFPDDRSYRSNVATFAGHLFDKRVYRKTVWIIEGGASVAMWDAPSSSVTEAVAGVELPAEPAPLELPAEATARLVAGLRTGTRFRLAVGGTGPTPSLRILGMDSGWTQVLATRTSDECPHQIATVSVADPVCASSTSAPHRPSLRLIDYADATNQTNTRVGSLP